MRADLAALVGSVARAVAAGIVLTAIACTEGGASGPATSGAVDATPDAGVLTPPPPPDASTEPADAGVAPADAEPPEVGPSPDARPPAARVASNLRFKRFDQLRLELQRVLALEADEVCQELDRFDCTHDVHRVALGGSDPYLANVYARAAQPPLNAPLAWERVVLTACAERVDRDLAEPEAASWLKEIEIDAAGQLDPASAAVVTAVRTLYREALLRDPAEAELDAWRSAYADLENEAAPGRSWARLVCGAVLTSAEFVFH